MRQYELMLVLRPKVDPTDTKAIELQVNKLLAAADVTVTSTTVLGKKPLAYIIKKETEGVFINVQLSGAALNMKALEAQVKLTDNVLRYLVTVKG
jgi:small subunit ribosomal protein S6